jgi:hydrogenase-4 component B
MSALLVLAAAALAALSGFPGLFLKRGDRGQRLATALSVLASLAGLTGTVLALVQPPTAVEGAWPLPGAHFAVRVDGLSAIFLLPLFLVSGLGAVYGESYWNEREHPDNARKLRAFYGLLTAGLALLFVARNSILFIIAWEVMALSAFFLVTTEGDKKESREAGTLYLMVTHTATLLVFAVFALLRSLKGSFDIDALPAGVAETGPATALFLLAVLGFGMKAGLMPLHIWLPSAHSAAPSHVSAIMSGVLIKSGIYGLVRIAGLFPEPPVWWGGLLVALGIVSGVLGVAFALGQHDLKRLLAYHSVENIGIIVIGLGLGLVGRSLGQNGWVMLGLGGALLHVVNHALFKSLLFFGAGAVIHATGTREMDRLGGLLPAMPHTALWFLVGAVAICGLPPLNGFVSEWLLYLGLMGTMEGGAGPSWPWGIIAVPGLALIGALAVACFVKAFGTVFLGQARTDDARHAHESSLLTVPMAVLAAACAAIGLVPLLARPLLEAAVGAAAPGAQPSLGSLAPLGTLGIVNLAFVGLLALRPRPCNTPRRPSPTGWCASFAGLSFRSRRRRA